MPDASIDMMSSVVYRLWTRALGLGRNSVAKGLWSFTLLTLWLSALPGANAWSAGLRPDSAARSRLDEPAPGADREREPVISPDPFVESDPVVNSAGLLPDLRTLPPTDLEIRGRVG